MKAHGPRSPFLLSAPMARVISRLFGCRLDDVALSSEVVSPPHTFFHPPAIFDKTDLERITGTATTTSREKEIAIALGKESRHGPSMAYVVKNVLLHRGIFYKGRYRRPVGLDRGSLIDVGNAEWLPGGVLSQCWLGSKYFGHSLHEEIPMALLGKARGMLVAVEREMTEQQRSYASLFSIQAEVLPRSVWLERLEILDDHAYSPSKVERWREMRRMVAQAEGGQEHAGVFLLRGATGQNRMLVNEEEIAEHFAKMGFRVINPGLAPFEEVLSAVAGAHIVVGVEGSQLVHGFLGVAEHGSFLVIQPPARFDNAYKERCDLLGIRYSFVVAHSVEGGFSVTTDQLDRALARLDERKIA